MKVDEVSLVIPGRNCAATVEVCLEAVVPLIPETALQEILFVDDGSTDETPELVSRFPVTYVAGRGEGPGSARNVGWRAAKHPLIWFVDSDCVAQPDALDKLLPHMQDPNVAGVGGSYGNMSADSLLSCLIHEEIVARHDGMAQRVNFLATFNVLYRRSVLDQLDGFDERYLKGQDAEFSWRVLSAGHVLAFEKKSRVRHFHAQSWRSYLRTQRQQGYWRVWLHLGHKGHALGDSYSRLLDHLQPPIAVATLASIPLFFFPYFRWIPVGLLLILWVAQVPMTRRLMRRTQQWRYICFALMSYIRAFWRGVGMTMGAFAYLRSGARAAVDNTHNGPSRGL